MRGLANCDLLEQNSHSLIQNGMGTRSSTTVSLLGVPKEKRKKYYISGGVFSLSTQIFLMDVLA